MPVLSLATVVIEAGVPSGTLITATAAAEQGRDVFALPWSVNHRGGRGCLELPMDGALLAINPISGDKPNRCDSRGQLVTPTHRGA